MWIQHAGPTGNLEVCTNGLTEGGCNGFNIRDNDKGELMWNEVVYMLGEREREDLRQTEDC